MAIDDTSDHPDPGQPPDRQPGTTDSASHAPDSRQPETASSASDTGSSQPTETRTRQEYADQMRGQGEPIADDPPPSRSTDTAQPQEHDSPTQPSDTGKHEPAEPRDRQTYADDLHDTPETTESPDASATREQNPDGFYTDQAAETPSSPSDHEPAETRDREQYADDARQDDPTGYAAPEQNADRGPAADDSPAAPSDSGSQQDSTVSPDQDPSAEQSDHPADGTGQATAEAEYYEPAAEQADSQDGSPTAVGAADSDQAPGVFDEPAGPDTHTQDEAPAEAESAADGQPVDAASPEPGIDGDSPAPDAPAVVDGTVAGNESRPPDRELQPDGEQEVVPDAGGADFDAPGETATQHEGPTEDEGLSELSDSSGPTGIPDDAEQLPDEQDEIDQLSTSANDEPRELTDAEAGDHGETDTESAASDVSLSPDQAERSEPEKVNLHGQDIEVTGNPHDGIWSDGLPGKAPDRVGDVLVSPEADERTLGDKFLSRAVESGDDLVDGVEKGVSLGFDGVQPPTHSEAPVRVGHYSPEVGHHDLDAGHAASGLLVLGAALWAGGRALHRKLKGA